MRQPSLEDLINVFCFFDRFLSFVSPRTRARRTLELLSVGYKQKQDELKREATASNLQRDAYNVDDTTLGPVEVTAKICEWDYGEYEGLKSAEINARREAAGEEVPFNIWKHGCPGGE